VTGGGSSLPEVQRLLAVLAAGKRCAEAGTAFGEGAAAMAATARSVVTVERDEERAAVAAERLAGLDNVELLVGDWLDELSSRAPFELLVFDAAGWARRQSGSDRRRSTCSYGAVSSSRTTSRLAAPVPIPSGRSSSGIPAWS
jgi:hypothetical protein